MEIPPYWRYDVRGSASFSVGGVVMATRVALIAVIIEDLNSIEAFNATVYEHRDIVIGRMGIPYKVRGINIVSIAVDGATAAINALSGKLGRLPGVTVKTAYANLPELP